MTRMGGMPGIFWMVIMIRGRRLQIKTSFLLDDWQLLTILFTMIKHGAKRNIEVSHR